MRLITDILREYRNGRAADMASRDLAECVRAVDETGKAAELTIKDQDRAGKRRRLSEGTVDQDHLKDAEAGHPEGGVLFGRLR